MRFLAVASGAFPSDTQISLEQDVALAASVLEGPGLTLLAAGPAAPVLALEPEAMPRTDDVRARLRDLFAPMAPSHLAYRSPRIDVDGPADRNTVLEALARASSRGDGPLLVYLGGHGEQGAAPAENRIVTWGGDGVTVADVADALSGAERPVLLVSSACFSGGLAEVALALPPDEGVPTVCGLFAAPWDREASGCDPDPERRAADGFALHFFPALEGRTFDGRSIPRSDIDFDGDGRIAPLEAHAYVRIFLDTADVPTTTSGAFALATAPEAGPARPVDLPVEVAVVERLSERFGVDGRPEHIARLLDAAHRDLASAEDALAEAQAKEDAAYRAVAAEILARWPGLDDPWRDDFERRLAAARPHLVRYFDTSSAYSIYLDARRRTDATLARLGAAARKAARLERLDRAARTLAAAGRLAAADPATFARFEALRACEKMPVPLARSGTARR
ncbi:MAG: hypothetical protein D6705_05995 [Deltaproteobacteria bacterium]|nr:MAG: hypothetical protein D6705_05995 [Deltaproteobacteria bacterium]